MHTQWNCTECDNSTIWSVHNLATVGTPVCDVCGLDMELDRNNLNASLRMYDAFPTKHAQVFMKKIKKHLTNEDKIRLFNEAIEIIRYTLSNMK